MEQDYLSYDPKTTFKSCFCLKNAKIVPYIWDIIMDVIT